MTSLLPLLHCLRVLHDITAAAIALRVLHDIAAAAIALSSKVLHETSAVIALRVLHDAAAAIALTVLLHECCCCV